jgi:RNA polymerase sigma factor (sigma-70 family)
MPASQPLAPRADVDHDDDSYLLLYMADAASNRVLAEAAFEVFVNRHWDMVMGFCLKQRYETFGDGAEHFVNETFLKAFKHAASFKPPPNGDEEAIHRKAQNWLFTILERIFLDARRKLHREIKARKPAEGDEKITPLSEQAETYADCDVIPRETKRQAISARRRTLMLQFMQELSDSDRAIFFQTQDYIDPNTGNTEPPPEELEALAAQFGIPTDHIRVYRQRILDRLQVFIIAAELSSS